MPFDLDLNTCMLNYMLGDQSLISLGNKLDPYVVISKQILWQHGEQPTELLKILFLHTWHMKIFHSLHL